jgi:hypothetical protein
MFIPLPGLGQSAALNKDTSFGPDSYAIHIGTNELWRTDGLIEGRTLEKVRLDLRTLVQRKIDLHGLCRCLFSALRRTSAEGEHTQRCCQSSCLNGAHPSPENLRPDDSSNLH